MKNVIRDNLGEHALQKIEKRLEQYNIFLNQSLTEFEKLDTVLHEFFGDGAEGLEEKILLADSKTKERSS